MTGRPGATPSTGGHEVEVERASAREADHRAVDAEIGEIRERPLQRDQLTRTGDAEPVALADHHAQRQGSGGDDRADEIERRRQAVALDLADDFQPVGAAGFGFLGVGDRLDDDFEKDPGRLSRATVQPVLRCWRASTCSVLTSRRAVPRAANFGRVLSRGTSDGTSPAAQGTSARCTTSPAVAPSACGTVIARDRPATVHPSLSATSGSTRVALCAGTHAASAATAERRRATAP